MSTLDRSYPKPHTPLAVAIFKNDLVSSRRNPDARDMGLWQSRLIYAHDPRLPGKYPHVSLSDVLDRGLLIHLL